MPGRGLLVRVAHLQEATEIPLRDTDETPSLVFKVAGELCARHRPKRGNSFK